MIEIKNDVYRLITSKERFFIHNKPIKLMAYLKIDELDSVQQKIKVSRIRQLLTLSQEGRRDIDQTFWFCLTNETKYNADNCPGTYFIYRARK